MKLQKNKSQALQALNGCTYCRCCDRYVTCRVIKVDGLSPANRGKNFLEVSKLALKVVICQIKNGRTDSWLIHGRDRISRPRQPKALKVKSFSVAGSHANMLSQYHRVLRHELRKMQEWNLGIGVMG